MSMNFTANQFEEEYRASKLRNWEIPKWFPERPCGNKGRTKIVSNEKGHLLPGVPRSCSSPWGNFVGTWDLPKKISRKEAFILSAPPVETIKKWRRHCEKQGCPPPRMPQITTYSKKSREAILREAALVAKQHRQELAAAIPIAPTEPELVGKKSKKVAIKKLPFKEPEDYLPDALEQRQQEAEQNLESQQDRKSISLDLKPPADENAKDERPEEQVIPEHMDEPKETHVCCPDKNKYTPGEFTEPHNRHPSHKDLVLGIYQQHIDDHRAKGYPRYRDDFMVSTSNECNCKHGEVEKDTDYRAKCEKEKSRKKGASPYLAAAKNFVFAKKLHKENLEHKPLPDTIADAMYRKAQMMGGEPGLMLKDGNYATGVGWKGYPGYGATRCTKLKVYRPKTCVHVETMSKKRPNSISSFDKKWRFIRQQKVTPIELAICWDMTPLNPHDEPTRSVHIDGSNGSQAPAVFTLVHTPKENIEKIVEECNCSPKTERPKTVVEKEAPPLCQTQMKRTKSAFNFHNVDKKTHCPHSNVCGNKLHKSTPNLTNSSCSSCSKRNDFRPNARLCIACELKDAKPKQKPKSEFKAAFKAGVPNNNKSVSVANYKVPVQVPRQRDPYKDTNYMITSLAPPFSFQSGKRHEYPDHWRLASVYQHSYKPIHLRKRSLLASIFL